jgi:hypothetical protein
MRLDKDRRKRKDVSIDDISELLHRLTSSSSLSGRYDGKANESGEGQPFDDPFHELFIFCIVFNRFVELFRYSTLIWRLCVEFRLEMSLYFWNQVRRPLLTALIGVWIARRLSKYFKDEFNEALVQSYEDIVRCAQPFQFEFRWIDKEINIIVIMRRLLSVYSNTPMQVTNCGQNSWLRHRAHCNGLTTVCTLQRLRVQRFDNLNSRSRSWKKKN